MSFFDELRTLGVDIDGGLKRLNGNEKLYTRLFGTFVKTIKANAIDMDFDAADLTPVIEKAHAIKGTAGNMSITPLYESYNEILTLLRTGKPEEARQLLQDVQQVQEDIMSCIEKNIG